MHILCFMPRNMRFGPSNATSIDLCVYDLIRASQYRRATKVVCCENETLFSGLDISTYPPAIDRRKARKIAFAIDQSKASLADVIVVEQHVPTAAALARGVETPVILHKHNLTKPVGGDGLFKRIKREWRTHQYNALSGIMFVSETCRDAFMSDWPGMSVPTAVVYNGLDFDEWAPADERRNEIVYVGRATPEKGVKEAAEAIADVLQTAPDWSGRLILSETKTFPDYFQSIVDVLRPLGERARIEVNQPLSAVRERMQHAAIAVVPSRWQEPFGRTALEAHAAGCALVSSGTGGLREISGAHALFLPQAFTARDVADRLKELIANDTLRTSLARDGRTHCMKKFSLDVVSASADRFYEQVFERHRSQAA
jgi:glycosyltransferase involved in cell wall biosynthesis